MIGIYKILNQKNQKCYVGSSINIENRWTKHKALLRNNKHENEHLQNSWNKHGESIFEFSIIEECSEEILLTREQFYLDTLLEAQSYFKDGGELFYSLGYNLLPICNKPFITEQAKEKISNSLKDGYSSGEIVSQSKKKVYQYNRISGELIKIWDSAVETNLHYYKKIMRNSKIHKCLWGYTPSAHNSVWSYEPITFFWAKDVVAHGGKAKPLVIVDRIENTYSFFSSLLECYSTMYPDVERPRTEQMSYCLKNNKLFKNRYEIIELPAPIIYDSKPFELLGTREDLITKTREEILNVNV